MGTEKPCCPAEALRRIKTVPVNGIPTGITMLEEVITEVKKMNLPSEQQIRETLLKKIKVYNYIPKAAEEAYLKAILETYHKNISW